VENLNPMPVRTSFRDRPEAQSVSIALEVACVTVVEPGKAMKWPGEYSGEMKTILVTLSIPQFGELLAEINHLTVREGRLHELLRDFMIRRQAEIVINTARRQEEKPE
jgi:hypothetical protein